MKLAYVVPSYSRPEVLLLLMDNASRQSANRRFEQVELIISIDRSDPECDRYASFVEQFKKIIEFKGLSLDVKLIINDSEGLVRAKNHAVESTDANLIMMLDDDLYMEDNYVELLIDDIEKDERIGAISGHIVSSVPAVSHTQESYLLKDVPKTGSKLQRLDIKNSDGEWRSVFGQKEQVMDWSEILDRLDGTTRYEMDYFVNSYLFRREVFGKIGGYNEELNSKTSAHEEVDFTYRIGRSGYKLLFNPFARMWHITIKQGGIYKGTDFSESKKILEKEYNESLPIFISSVTSDEPVDLPK